jgi:ubiquinone/menaquinone biosynthesis C-methylase UbiE
VKPLVGGVKTEAMTKENQDRMSNFAFQIMSAVIALEELFPQRIDQRVLGFGIQKGQTVVDYGCGPGRYTTRFAKLVGEHGKVYAVDVQELALEDVKKKMKAQGITNTIPVVAHGYETEIPDHSADMVLALDMFFLVKDPSALLAEIHRILRPDGLLILAACRRERSSGHISRSESARILHTTSRSNSMELTYRQNTVGQSVLFGLEGCRCPWPTPKIRYGSA